MMSRFCGPIRRRGFCVVIRCRSRPRWAGFCAASALVISVSSTALSTSCSGASTRSSARETVTLDLDASYVEHHGPVGSRQGTRGVYTGKVAWHPLLCFVGETGEWLHAKLRNGHAAASTGARRFLAECLRRVPEGVRLFLRADEGFYGKDFLAECERRRITYTIGAQLNRALRERIAAVVDDDWQPSSYRDGSEVTSFVWRPRD